MTQPTQETVYLASYKGTAPGLHGLLNRAIRWLTRSPYSHSEVCVGHPFMGVVPCVSSSGSEGGVRLKRMRLNPDKWDILPMPWVKPVQVSDFWLNHRKSGYDYTGAARFLLPWLVGPSNTRWFCTEVAAAIAGYSEPWRFAPADFHIIVESWVHS